MLAFRNTFLLLAVCAASAVAQPDWQTAAGGKMSFEVASIKPSAPGKFVPPAFPLDSGDAFASTGGRFTADFPLVVFITFAYKLNLSGQQMQAMTEHLPKWVTSDRFSVQAKAEGNPTKDQMRLMMQSLLADRFQLAVHFETQQDVPIFVVTLLKPGKLGPNLRPHADGPSCDAPDPKVFPPRCDVYGLRMLPGKMPMYGSRNTTMDALASAISGFGNLGRPSINQTGLTGRFDFTLEFMRERETPLPVEAGPQPELQGPSFLEAFHEQLGLKLESSRGPVQTMVVDHVERPSEN